MRWLNGLCDVAHLCNASGHVDVCVCGLWTVYVPVIRLHHKLLSTAGCAICSMHTAFSMNAQQLHPSIDGEVSDDAHVLLLQHVINGAEFAGDTVGRSFPIDYRCIATPMPTPNVISLCAERHCTLHCIRRRAQLLDAFIHLPIYYLELSLSLSQSANVPSARIHTHHQYIY